MSFGSDMRQFLLGRTDIAQLIGTRAHQNHVPAGYGGTYLWFARSGHAAADTLDMAAGDDPFETTWDVECISSAPDEAMDLAELVLGLHGYRGAFGEGTVQGIFVETQTDGYVPQGVGLDEALEVGALICTIFGYTP